MSTLILDFEHDLLYNSDANEKMKEIYRKMQCFFEVVPLIEACIYLSERFSKNRTADRIKYFESYKPYMSNEKWTCFQKIGELQKELDDLIPIDDTMKQYFTPLKTQIDIPSDKTLSLGMMLLSLPLTLDYPFSYDDFIGYCRSLPQQELLAMYCNFVFFPFFKYDIDAEEEIPMSRFISTVKNTLVDIDDKWMLIDCAADPFEHLEKLRPIVTRVMDIIERRSKEMQGFIKQEFERFCEKDQLAEKLRKYLRTDIKSENLETVKIYPSLMSVNGIQMVSHSSNTCDLSKLIIGIYVNTAFELRQRNDNDYNHIKLLKMLSDQTRFNILHDLCGRQSYGQELADKYGGARSAIYYHLEKLLGFGLIDLEMTEYRNLYTMNKQNVYDKMNEIRDYLLDGWKPEAKQEEAQAESPRSGKDSDVRK